MTHPASPETAVAGGLDDPRRFAEIAALGLASDVTDPVLQDTAREAAELLDLPTALVSVVMDRAQYFAAHHGLSGWMAEARGTPVEWSFCANAVRTGEPFVVEDASTHPLVRENPLVTVDGIRCYAGIPLVSSNGIVLGTLCVIGTEARTFSDVEMDTLRALAARAVARIESRRGATDPAEALTSPPEQPR